MVKKPPRVILDTNIIVSALIFKGTPEKVYNLVLEKEIIGVISLNLIAELSEVLTKKFNFDSIRIEVLQKIIKKHFKIVYPTEMINFQKDDDDNRVLEAGIEGSCDFIITGDKELLELGKYKEIKIVSAKEFLDLFYEN